MASDSVDSLWQNAQPTLQPEGSPSNVLTIPTAAERANTQRPSGDVGTRGDIGIPDAVVQAIIATESSGKPTAVGKKGEMGLMQITPGVAQMYGVPVGDLMDPETNKRVGRQYLNDLLKQFQGNIAMTIAAYNAGPGAVKKGEIPDSTRKYVMNVLNKIASGVGRVISDREADAAEGDPWNSAKPVGDPWAKAKPVNAPSATNPLTSSPDQPNRIEQGYEKYIRDPIRAATKTDAVRLAIPKLLGPLGSLIPDKDVPDVGPYVAPDTATQFATQAGLAATGLGDMGLVARLALPTALAAGTAKVTGDDVLGASGEALASQAGGELLGWGGGVLGRAFGKNRLLENTSEQIGSQIAQQIPTLGNAPDSTAEMEKLFVRGGIIDRVSQATKPLRDRIAKISSGIKFDVPVMKRSGKVTIAQLPLPEAEKELTNLGEIGFLRGDVRNLVASREARAASYRTRGQIAAKLNQLQPGIGDQWLAARKQMGAASAIKRLFDPANELLDTKTGQIDQPRLVRAILDNYEDLARNLGPKGAEDLLKSARRGTLAPVSDIGSKEMHAGIRGHLGGISPHVSMPRTYRGVGNIPAYMKSKTYRMPAALAIEHYLRELQDENP